MRRACIAGVEEAVPAASTTLRLLLPFLLILPIHDLRAADASWRVPDSPFRAEIRLKERDRSRMEDPGILIDLPEFGQTRDDMGDVVLVDGTGQPLPLAKIRRGEGQHLLLLAQSLEPGKSYHVYCGGNTVRTGPVWTPRTSLLMETRRLPDGAKFDTWPEMQKTWKSAGDMDGAGFVPSINQGGNPFGADTNFVTHYTGWLLTGGTGDLTLYTLSSDASFVLVNDTFEFAWPGSHSPRANQKNVHSKTVKVSAEAIKIDYYHAKAGGDEPATVLGWQKGGRLVPVPADAWLHPATAVVQKIEDRRGWPVPVANIEPLTYIGYGNRWYFETSFVFTGPLPDGWRAEWLFPDGANFAGTDCRRVIAGGKPQTVVLKLRSDTGETRGVKRFDFPDNIRAASVNDAADIARYLDLLGKETPAQLAKETLDAGLVLLLDFGKESQAAPFADAWLQKKTDARNPLWLPAQLARLHVLAQSDPKKALDDLKKIDPDARKTAAQSLDLLELDLLVFYLFDATITDTAKRVEFLYPNSETARLARIRAGDFFRLTGQFKQAIDQYQGVQNTIVDESAGRKLPAQDQAYSITVRNLIGKNMRGEAADKLREWELKHPMAKFDGDFLLLRGRILNAFGRWTESLAELDSFKKIQRDSPWQIDADFYRAEALAGLGKRDEAVKIWNDIAKNYPKHELAGEAGRRASMKDERESMKSEGGRMK